MESFYSGKSQGAQRQLVEWNGEAQSQKATASALSGYCHQQFGLKEWLFVLKCLYPSPFFFFFFSGPVVLFLNLKIA